MRGRRRDAGVVTFAAGVRLTGRPAARTVGGMAADDVTTVRGEGPAAGSCCRPPAEAATPCCGSSAATAPPRPQQSCCGSSAVAPPPEPQQSCCGPASEPAGKKRAPAVCCGSSASAPAGPYAYPPLRCVAGTVTTAAGEVPRVTARLDRGDRLGVWRVRWKVRRDDYRVEPGLYALGAPTPASPVLVTANYKLTFDEVRSSVGALDAWLLVVDTRGVNVWCAAGKGTFCAAEVARLVRETRLAEIVEHRRLVLPQLSAPGVAAHEVKEACGFRVTFGPVRIADLPAFLAAGMKADEEMRRVTFDARERVVVVPEVLSFAWDRRMLLACAGAVAASSLGRDGVSLRRGLRDGGGVVGAAWLALLAGGAVTPLALPYLPGRAFSGKGAVAGGVLAGAAAVVLGRRLSPAARLALLAGVTAGSSYTAMNFTGSSTLTSPSGVEAEMRRALPLQGAAAALAVAAWLVSRLER